MSYKTIEDKIKKKSIEEIQNKLKAFRTKFNELFKSTFFMGSNGDHYFSDEDMEQILHIALKCNSYNCPENELPQKLVDYTVERNGNSMLEKINYIASILNADEELG